MKTVCSMLAVGALAMAGAACAGPVQVTVTDKEGKPVADVVVLLDATRRTTLRPADEPVVILQEGLRFVPFLTGLPSLSVTVTCTVPAHAAPAIASATTASIEHTVFMVR